MADDRDHQKPKSRLKTDPLGIPKIPEDWEGKSMPPSYVGEDPIEAIARRQHNTLSAIVSTKDTTLTRLTKQDVEIAEIKSSTKEAVAEIRTVIQMIGDPSIIRNLVKDEITQQVQTQAHQAQQAQVERKNKTFLQILAIAGSIIVAAVTGYFAHGCH